MLNKTEQFIDKANKIHNFKYNYCEVNYATLLKDVKIACKDHGTFLQKPSIHLKGGGCQLCGKSSVIKKNSSTQEEFVSKANKIHNFKYDYNKINYKCSKEKIEIICKKHGIFWQRPSCHLTGKGCLLCSREKIAKNQSLSQKEFIERSNKIHNFIYCYSKINYKTRKIKVEIVCNSHGSFYQYPGNHLQGQGCPTCGIEKSILKVNKETNKIAEKEFIDKANKIHNLKYDYSKTVYIKARVRIEIVCKKHGSFWQTPNHHLLDHGCPKCACVVSKPHKKVINYLEQKLLLIKNSDFIINDRSVIKPMELDLYFPKISKAIEIDGVYYHSFDKAVRRDKIKDQECKNKGIKILRITDTEINNSGNVYEKIKEFLN